MHPTVGAGNCITAHPTGFLNAVGHRVHARPAAPHHDLRVGLAGWLHT